MKHVKRLSVPARAVNVNFAEIFAFLNIANLGLWVTDVLGHAKHALFPNEPVLAGDPEDVGEL